MRYVSTRGKAPPLDFAGVLLAGLAEDGGLYVPETWPKISTSEATSFEGQPYSQVATNLMARFTESSIHAGDLEAIIDEAYRDFFHPEVAPLRNISPTESVLELFHGPTLSFKDYALQVVGRLFDHVLQRAGLHMTVVGATSGDTGSAAIEAVQGRDSITAFILHPKGRVTSVQRRQMTTVNSKNIHNIAIEGTFDDCQALVKKMFGDVKFRKKLRLTAVNSINWARVMAQVVYYFTTFASMSDKSHVPSFSVPTGNFGDAFAGHVARRMGLLIPKIVIATNQNDILVRLLQTGEYRKGDVHATISPSIDIQVSSNFERLLFELADGNSDKVVSRMKMLEDSGMFVVGEKALEKMRNEFSGRAVSESETLGCMREFWETNNYIIDPHTAVGIVAGRADSRINKDQHMVYLSTAHPAKFPDAVFDATGINPDLPEHMSDLMLKDESYDILPNDQNIVQSYINGLAPD